MNLRPRTAPPWRPTLAAAPALLLLAGGALLLPACQSSLERIEDWEQQNPPGIADDIRELRAPDGFDFATAHARDLELAAVRPDGATPVGGVAVSVWTDDGAGAPALLAYGTTDDQGSWHLGLSVPADRDSLTLRVETPGFAREHRVAIAGTGATAYTFGRANANGRVVAGPVPPEEVDTAGVASGELLGRAAMTYLGAYDAQGVPDYLTTPGDIWPDVLDFIAVNLPEDSGVPETNPHYLEDRYRGSVLMREEGELWISFAHEGAGYRNAIGYFTFPLDDPPTRKRDVARHTVVFPNASFAGSGGGLAVGDRVYLGRFPANTGVGYFLVPNGWNASTQTVGDKWNTRYTVDALNTFTRKKKHRKHAVLLANPVREFLVLGFEDLNRPGGDNDFNDAVFIVEPRPWSSVITEFTPAVKMPGDDLDGDGVANNLDLYPTDPERAFEAYAPARGEHGTLAYEDMWPRTSDYDFNDLVVDWSATEVLNSASRVKDIRFDLRVRAIGASQNHGFAVRLPVPAAAVERVVGQALTNGGYIPVDANGTEAGMPEAIVPMFTDGFALFDERFGIINTDPAKPALAEGALSVTVTFAQPLYREEVGVAPYDPFLLRSQDRAREIHLPGIAPTSRADVSAFGTYDDASDPALGRYYLDANNLPWALCLPASMRYPKEQVSIDEVYLDFAEWATYGGTSARGWFRDNGGNVDAGGSY